MPDFKEQPINTYLLEEFAIENVLTTKTKLAPKFVSKYRHFKQHFSKMGDDTIVLNNNQLIELFDQLHEAKEPEVKEVEPEIKVDEPIVEPPKPEEEQKKVPKVQEKPKPEKTPEEVICEFMLEATKQRDVIVTDKELDELGIIFREKGAFKAKPYDNFHLPELKGITFHFERYNNKGYIVTKR